ncbi:MAG: hypothetical protein LLF96_01795 [Eubacteriales bacterium]|nr:hypothetical protein [Eubacteriales bacterium]
MPGANRYLKTIVAYCIAYLSVFHAAAFVAKCFGVDVSAELYYTDIVFGGELMMTCVVKLFDRKAPPPDTKLPEK